MMTRLETPFMPHGLCAFPMTPADAAGRVDAPALQHLVARLVQARVESIGVLGSTGIAAYLTRQERRRALEAALAASGGKVPVVAGIGALRTDDAVAHARDARDMGAAAGLLAPFSYTPLTQEEVFVHFATVAREGGLPLVIYDNPTTTHFSFTPDLVARLAQVPGIVAIKNPGVAAHEAAAHLAAQRARVPAGFSIGCSGDWLAGETLIAGADCWYSVLGGLLPAPCQNMLAAIRRGDVQEARRLNAKLEPLWALFRTFSSLRVIYALAQMLELCTANPPRPILPLPDAARQDLAGVLARLAPEPGLSPVSR